MPLNEPRSGVFTFYHDGKKGQPIPFKLQDDITRDEFLRRACADPTNERFEIEWDARGETMPITKEQLDELVELYEQMPEGPYFADFDDGGDCPAHANSGLAVVDTGRESDWPIARHCHWPVAKWVVLSRAAMPALLGMLAEKDKRIAELREALKELADSPAEFDDPRIRYVSVQMDQGALEAAKKLLESQDHE